MSIDARERSIAPGTVLPKVSVVIPCLNERGQIERCLDSIIVTAYPKDRMEVLVVDGGSEDGTRRVAAEYGHLYPFVRLLDNPKRDQQAAMNIGVQAAKGDVIIRIDAHAAFQGDYVTEAVRQLERTGADCVGGRIITLPRTNSAVGRAIALAMSEPFGVGNSRFRVIRDGISREAVEVDTVPYGCYWRRVFLEVGGFDESLPFSEDIALHLRMRRRGLRIVFVPSLVSYYYARSNLRSFWRHALRNGMWAVLPTRYIGRLVVSVRHLVPLGFVATLLGLSALAIFMPPARWPLALVAGSYLLVNATFSTRVALRERDPRLLVTVPMCFTALHIGYGLGSLAGLMRLVGYWVVKPWPRRRPA